MNKLKSGYICLYCSKILKNPIELPCEDLICKEHLTENGVLKNDKIKCHECKQEFKVKGVEFKSNKFAQKKINEQIYLSDQEISLKQKIEDSIKLFYSMYEEFTSSKTQLDLDCHNHFQEVRLQLDMHREKFKEKIDDIYMEMIEKTKEFEVEYLNSIKKNIETSLQSFEIKSICEDLKEVEDKFRDPNILIKTIEEMNLKQQEAIAMIQLNLNTVNQVKDDLKASNQFEPNLAFGNDFFGQLNLNEYSSFDPFMSQILTGQQPLELMKLCEFGLKTQFKLLYRATEHGFASIQFHSKCNGHANTLTILKASLSSFIFGGFTTAI